MAETGITLDQAALTAFGLSLAQAGGVDAAQAETLIENLVWNDAAGRHNHGFDRLPVMLDRVARGGITCPAPLRFDALTPSMARLDAGGGFGQHAGAMAVARAVEMARTEGLGLVGVANSNFFGTGARFVAMAAEAGMISLVLSNATPKVAPPEGHAAALGTNPLAFGAPGPDAPMIVDFSSAAVAGSTLRAAERDGAPLPEGALVGGPGLLASAAGPKGFGIALMVEVLAGVLTGAGVGHGVGSLYHDRADPADNGHMILVLDPARWMAPEDFLARMAALTQTVVDAGGRMPGEARHAALKTSDRAGVRLSGDVWQGLVALAEKFHLPCPELVPRTDQTGSLFLPNS